MEDTDPASAAYLAITSQLEAWGAPPPTPASEKFHDTVDNNDEVAGADMFSNKGSSSFSTTSFSQRDRIIADPLSATKASFFDTGRNFGGSGSGGNIHESFTNNQYQDDDNANNRTQEIENVTEDDFASYITSVGVTTPYNTNTKRYGNDEAFTPMSFSQKQPDDSNNSIEIFNNPNTSEEGNNNGVSTTHLYSLNKRYHDALEIYLEKNRVEEEKIFLEEEEHLVREELNDEVISMDDDGGNTNKASKGRRVAIELELVDTYALISSTSGNGFGNAKGRECQIWKLMDLLHRQNLLLYTPSEGEFDKMSGNTSTALLPVEASPSEVLEQLYNGNNTTSIQLRRRSLILKWLQNCVYSSTKQLLDPPTSYNNSSANANIDSNTNDEESECHNREVLASVLQYLRCGDIDGACELCKRHGQSWRIPTLKGGSTASKEHMNPNRALWKRTCAQLASVTLLQYKKQQQQRNVHNREALKTFNALAYESAIYALLSNNTAVGLENPALRNWEDGMLLYYHSLIGDTLDQALASHALQQQLIGKRFPFKNSSSLFAGKDISDDNATGPMLLQNGNDNTLKVNETKNLVNDEYIFSTLTKSNFAQVQNEATKPLSLCIASICVGWETVGGIQDFLLEYLGHQLGLDESNESNLDSNTMRFIVHYLLWLTAATATTTNNEEGNSNNFDEENNNNETRNKIMEMREEMLRRYIATLISNAHYDMVALYTSLLSNHENQVQLYVEFMLPLTLERERKMTLGLALKHDLPTLEIVLGVMERLLLIEEESNTNNNNKQKMVRVTVNSDNNNNSNNNKQSQQFLDVTNADLTKLQSIQWLTFHSDHHVWALSYANKLLRQFLLSKDGNNGSSNTSSKVSECKLLLMQFFPREEILDSVKEFMNEETNMDQTFDDDNEMMMELAQEAILEHTALCLYLESHTCYEQWRTICALSLRERPTTPPSLNYNNASSSHEFTSMIASAGDEISLQNDWRLYNKEVIRLSKKVVTAAKHAGEALMALATFPGGWLNSSSTNSPSKSSAGGADDNDDNLFEQHKEELEQLQKICLPHTIQMLHVVLDGTASFLEKINSSDSTTILGNNQQQENESSNEGSFRPRVWYQRALNLATLVAHDNYNLMDMYSHEQLQSFMTRISNTSTKLLHCTGDTRITFG